MTSSGEYVCGSGAVFEWTLEERNGAGIVGGGFVGRPTAADVEEAKEFVRGKVPENGRTVFEKVLTGPTVEVRQQAASLRDSVLGRPSRN